MSTTIQSTPAATARPDRPDPRRWKALAVLGLIALLFEEVTGQDASLAAGVQIAMQAIGGAIGLACLGHRRPAIRRGSGPRRRAGGGPAGVTP
jgi:hypothetical protein